MRSRHPAAISFRRLRHVSGEGTDVLLGEDRLQGAPTRKPRFVGEVEEVRAEQVAHLLMNDRLLDMCPGATEDVVRPLR